MNNDPARRSISPQNPRRSFGPVGQGQPQGFSPRGRFGNPHDSRLGRGAYGSNPTSTSPNHRG